MENAGKEETPEDAERKGLGTTATRAGIIEKLISAGFAERKGKKLIPTKDGYCLLYTSPPRYFADSRVFENGLFFPYRQRNKTYDPCMREAALRRSRAL